MLLPGTTRDDRDPAVTALPTFEGWWWYRRKGPRRATTPGPVLVEQHGDGLMAVNFSTGNLEPVANLARLGQWGLPVAPPMTGRTLSKEERQERLTDAAVLFDHAIDHGLGAQAASMTAYIAEMEEELQILRCARSDGELTVVLDAPQCGCWVPRLVASGESLAAGEAIDIQALDLLSDVLSSYNELAAKAGLMVSQPEGEA